MAVKNDFETHFVEDILVLVLPNFLSRYRVGGQSWQSFKHFIAAVALFLQLEFTVLKH